MDCFFLFGFEEGRLTFEAEYSLKSAVHIVRGYIKDVQKLSETTGAEGDRLLRLLTVRFSANNRLFDFLNKNGIEFIITEKSFADTSSDV